MWHQRGCAWVTVADTSGSTVWTGGATQDPCPGVSLDRILRPSDYIPIGYVWDPTACPYSNPSGPPCVYPAPPAGHYTAQGHRANYADATPTGFDLT